MLTMKIAVLSICMLITGTGFLPICCRYVNTHFGRPKLAEYAPERSRAWDQ